MKSILILLSALLMLGGCSTLAERDPHLTVYARANLADQVRVTALYPGERGRVAAGRVEVVDDIGRVRYQGALNERGQLRFRYPDRAVYVDVRVIAPDGMEGEKRVEPFERDNSCLRIPGC